MADFLFFCIERRVKETPLFYSYPSNKIPLATGNSSFRVEETSGRIKTFDHHTLV